jgi:hypothetical protein
MEQASTYVVRRCTEVALAALDAADVGAVQATTVGERLEIWEASSADKLAIADALNRLDAAGLIERRGGNAIASEVATYFDRTMTL